MEKTGKPVAAGVICIILGALGILSALYLVVGLDALVEIMETYGAGNMTTQFMRDMMVVSGVISAILSVLMVIGGIYSLQRKLWGLALAGSIASVLGAFPFGIIPLVLVSISKKEFDTVPER